MEVFPPAEFAKVDFADGIILYTTDDPIGPTVRRGLKPYQGPTQVSLH